MTPNLQSLDHLVLTVVNISATCDFYEKALGMTIETFCPADGSMRTALKFGSQKINLHQKGAEFEPKANCPASGSADLCFVSNHTLDCWITHLKQKEIPILAGPVSRTGATGALISIYIRDPDGNLIEISNHDR